MGCGGWLLRRRVATAARPGLERSALAMGVTDAAALAAVDGRGWGVGSNSQIKLAWPPSWRSQAHVHVHGELIRPPPQ